MNINIKSALSYFTASELQEIAKQYGCGAATKKQSIEKLSKSKKFLKACVGAIYAELCELYRLQMFSL